MKPKLLLAILLLLSAAAGAQQYAITGVIKSAAGPGIQSATVFLAGSQRATTTDATGKFNLPNISAGNYKLMVSMIGHAPIKKSIAIRDKSAYLDTVMQIKPVILDEVKIGNGSLQKDYFKTFTKAFLGRTGNARSCTILNPEKIEFSTTKKMLKAYADDFLIIENKNLGYRIKYLLRNFEFEPANGRTLYEGETVFEELPGTDEQKQKWAKKRRDTYDGSFMCYLRAVANKRSRDEGFLSYPLIKTKYPQTITANPLNTDELITRLDNGFYKFKDTIPTYVIYDKRKAAKPDPITTKTEIKIPFALYRSFFTLNVEVDDRGFYPSTKDYMLYGYWAEKRVGDQLPREYNP